MEGGGEGGALLSRGPRLPSSTWASIPPLPTTFFSACCTLLVGEISGLSEASLLGAAFVLSRPFSVVPPAHPLNSSLSQLLCQVSSSPLCHFLANCSLSSSPPPSCLVSSLFTLSCLLSQRLAVQLSWKAGMTRVVGCVHGLW